MAVTDGDTVKLHYVGRLDDGEIFDTSDRVIAQQEGIFAESSDRVYRPLTVELGEGSVIPGLAEALIGMEIGEQQRVVIPPEQAYGEYSEERIAEYDREAFEEMLGDRELVEGFTVETNSGLEGRVVEFTDNNVMVDFNHELAGETLTFDIEIIDIDSTESD